MKARMFAPVVLLVGLALVFAWAVVAEEPEPPVAPRRGSPPRSFLDWDGGRPFRLPPTESNSKDVSPAASLGQPGTVFRYVQTFGETEVAYFEDADHLNYPYGVGIDETGNLWVAEISGARAIKYTADGSFVTSIGTAGLIGRADDTHFYSPADVAVDGGGNIWVVDRFPARVVKYNSGGNYLTQLGDTWESGSDNDHFNQPCSIAFDSAGNIYVSDANNHRIQVFDSSGTYSTTIGMTGESGSDNAHFNTTRHIAIDSNDNLYVADAGNHRVQIFDNSHNYVATIGVSGEPGSDNDHFDWPMGMAVDANHIYVADVYNHRTQVFDRTTRAYQNTVGTGSEGSGNNEFAYPSDVAVDLIGNIYVADQVNCRVQKFDNSLVYQHTFGTTGVPYLTDGYHYNEPADVAVDASGNIGIVEGEGGGNRFIKLNPNGMPQFIVGQAGIWGTDNAHFNGPRGVAFDASGNIYVADTYNDRIQIFNSNGTYQTTLGTGWGASNYQFNHPRGVAVDNSGNIYVADSENHRVQIYNSSRIYVATLGVTGETGSDNSHFHWPIDVYVDGNGNIYVADAGNQRVQKFNSSYAYQYTVGTTGESGDDFDHFDEPSGVALDANGNIYVADRYNNRVQVFDSSGAYLTTIGGDWGNNIGRFNEPTGVEVDSTGNVYVADHHNHRIQEFVPGVPGWEQVNINGFGDRDNWAAWSLGTFNNALYVSTGNFASGAEVYRLSSGSWEPVVTGGFGDSTNVAVDWFTEFDGHLYASTWNDDGSGGSNGGQIWRSSTGNNNTWERVVNKGFGDVANSEIMVLTPFNGYLYAGTLLWDTSLHGAEIWRSPTGNSGSWTRVVSNGFNDDSNNGAILSMDVFDGYLYAVTENSQTGGEVWRTSNGTTWTQANSDGFGDADNTRVVSLEAFDSQLYAGTWNSNTGGEIWRTANGISWEQVMSGGFDNVDNRDIASLVAFDGNLYAIVGNFNTGPEVWRSSTGDSGSWRKVIDTGFGGGRAAAVDWDNMTAVFEDSLYVGTFTWGNGGGRVWMMLHQAYLPLVLRHWPPIPHQPSLNPIQDEDDGNYTVSWSEQPARLADLYVLEEATDSAFTSSVRQVCTTAQQSCSVSGKLSGTYYYRVRGQNDWGYSEWSNVQAAQVLPPEAPVLNPIQDPEHDGVYDVTWEEAARATSYVLEESTNRFFSAPDSVYAGSARSWKASHRLYGVYYYRVAGVGPTGQGPWSDSQSIQLGRGGLFVDTQSRQDVLSFFQMYYLSPDVPIDWNGSHNTCNPGSTAQGFRDSIAQRINYFRAMAGLPADVTFSDEYTRKAQAAALMMSVNRRLSHSPAQDWLCYSSDGAEGAGSSNLFLGVMGRNAISGYVLEGGVVGHRRWILYPQTQEMGTGDIPSTSGYPASNALWVFDDNMWGPRPVTRDEFVAWPPPGYVPYQVELRRN